MLDHPISLACLSGKGGVGKTTTVVSLAASLAELGYNVLAVDCDPQSNLTSGLMLDPYERRPTISEVLHGDLEVLDVVQPTCWSGLWVLPASPGLAAVEAQLASSLHRELRLAEAMRRDAVEEHFDAVLYDTPPNFGFHTMVVLAATRHILVPLQMSGFALRGLKELLRVLHAAQEQLNPELTLLGIAPTFVNARTRLGRDILASLAELKGIRVFDVRIPLTVRLQETSIVGMPITSLAPSSAAAAAYRELALQTLKAAADGARTDALLGGNSKAM